MLSGKLARVVNNFHIHLLGYFFFRATDWGYF